jgi:hypothetical protein
VGLMDGGGILAFAAGFLHANSADAAGALADQMLAISRDTKVAMLFGIDVGAEKDWAPLTEPPESLVFACEAGRRVLWPARQLRPAATAPGPAEPRCISLGGTRVGIVIGGEVFNGTLRRELEHARPEMTVLLTHMGPSLRWKSALQGLSGIAPLVITGESAAGCEPTWSSAPPGWEKQALGGTPSLTLYRYGPEPALAECAAV